MYFSILSTIAAAAVPAAAVPAGTAVFCVTVFPDVTVNTWNVIVSPIAVSPVLGLLIVSVEGIVTVSPTT